MAHYETVLNQHSLNTHFKFDETSGDKAYCSVNPAFYYDLGTSTVVADSLVPTDPTGKARKHVTGTVTSSGALTNNLFGVNKSITFIISPHGTNTAAGFLIGNSDATKFGFSRDYVSGTQRLYVKTYYNNTDFITDMDDGSKYHIVLTHYANIVDVYVNGTLATQLTGRSISNDYIDRLFTTNSDVTVDHLAIIDDVLTAAEVEELATAARVYDKTITGAIDETIAADEFFVRAHRLDSGTLTAETTVTSPAINFSLTIPDVPHYVTVIPDQGVRHETGEVYSLGDKVYPSDAVTTPFYYECTTAGTSGGTEPSWTTTPAATIADGGVIWTIVGRLIQPVTHSPLTQ